MERNLRFFAIALFASLLTACGGGGQSSLSPLAQSPTQAAGVRVPLGSHSVVGADGRTVQVMWSRDFQHTNDLLRSPMRRPGGGSNLTLHGGPIQSAAKIYFIQWGSAWGTSGGDPDNAKAYLSNFYTHMTSNDTSGTYSGHNWHSVDTQYYCCSPQTNITQGTTLAGTYNDTSNQPPSSPTQSQIAAEAAAMAAHFGDHSVNASYVIALPSGIHPNGFQTQWCAWHSSTSTSGGTIAYTNLPYQPDAGASCGASSVAGVNDGFSIVGGHEQMETETDPQPNSGWLDSAGSENGDKCAWVSLGIHDWGGSAYGVTAFPTQPIWDNAITGCSQTGV